MPLLSVIVPVYNSEKYLPKCLDSIRSQSFRDFEVILVNDGSKDGSKDICNYYADQDKRFLALHLKNSGVSHARNIGLEHSTGQYVTFIDSDDWIESNMFETYINAFNSSNNIDAVKVGYYQDSDKGTEVIACSDDMTFCDKSDLFKFLEETRYYSFVWNICIRREKVKGLKFNEEINWLEDHIFCYDYYFHCRKVKVMSVPLYHYMNRASNDSLSNVKNPRIVAESMRIEYELKTRLNGGKYPEVDRQIKANYLFNVNRLVNVIYNSDITMSERHKFSRLALKETGLYYPMERIFFNKWIPFIFRDMLIRLYRMKIEKRI